MDTRPLMRLTRPGRKSSAALLGVVASLVVSSCGGGEDCGGPFCLGLGQPEPTTLTRGTDWVDDQTAPTGRELTQPLEVIVTDDDGRAVPDVVVTFTVSQGTLAETGEIRSDVQGRAQAHWTLGSAPGPQTAQASANGASGSPLKGAPVNFSVQAVRPPPVTLALRQAPSVAARNGIPLEQQPIVEVLDSEDQPVPDVQVTAALASGGGTLSGTTTTVSDGTGRATYTDLALTGPSGPRTIRFSVAAPALEVVSPTIVVGAGAPAELAGVAPLSYTGTVNSPVAPAPSVLVKDAAENGVPGISVTFVPNLDGAVSPQVAVTDENGRAQVTSWTLGSSASAQYTLTARVEGSTLTPVSFSATARPGAAGRLLIVTQPSSPAQNAVEFTQQPVIQVADREGNPAPQGGVRITASVSSGPTGDLQNATATTNGSGRAAFSGLTLTGAVGNYTISFSAGGLQGVTSGPVALGVGAPTKLAFATAPPANAHSRVALTPQPVIQAQDVSGNPVPQGDISVVASVGAPDATRGQATIATDQNGRATFTDLAIMGAPGQKTLTFTSSNPVLQPISATVTLPEAVRIDPVPGLTGVVGTTLTGVSIGVLKDVSGNPVADAAFTLTPASGTGPVAPANGVSGDNGVVTADSWTLGTVAGDQAVEIRVSETVALTAHLVATAAAPDLLQKISGDGQSAAPGSQLDSALVVQVLDQYGNGVPDASVQWRGCNSSEEQNTTTDGQGFASILVTTESQAGQFCVNAHSPNATDLQIRGSPVTFNYTVMGSAPMNPSTGITGPVFKAGPISPHSSQPRREPRSK
jgi:5-hydroxyisourate hydrolase-like protein (transthyretin family)